MTENTDDFDPDNPRKPKPDKKPPQQPVMRIVGMGMGGMDPGDVPEPIRMLMEAMGGGPNIKDAIDEKAPTTNRVRSLRSLAASMDKPRDFGPGDIVRFKDGLNISRIKNVAICRKVYDPEHQQVSAVDNHGSPLWKEPLDTVIGCLLDDGNFLEYHVDGRRLEKVPPEELALDFPEND